MQGLFFSIVLLPLLKVLYTFSTIAYPQWTKLKWTFYFNVLVLTSQLNDDENDEGGAQSPDSFDDAIEDLEREEPNGSVSQGDSEVPLKCQCGGHACLKHLSLTTSSIFNWSLSFNELLTSGGFY